MFKVFCEVMMMIFLPSDPVQLKIGPLTVSLKDFGGRRKR